MNQEHPAGKVLVVDDESEIRQILKRCVEAIDLECYTANNGRSALQLCKRVLPDVVILDIRLPDLSGLDLLQTILQLCPDTAVLMLTAFDDSRIAVDAIRHGARDYLTKPVDIETLQHRILQAIEHIRMKQDLLAMKEDDITPISFHGMIGRSVAMRKTFQLLTRIGPSKAPVLLSGESGTGKRLAAQVLHRLSHRRPRPFVVVDCGTVPTQLLESELFGYEKGAFTGADKRKMGRLEQADQGTLFLDEISNLPPDGQAKILRFLDENVIRRLGGDQDIQLDVRVIAATNKPLTDEVAAGHFREDLYFRLNVFEIILPPLRERTDDIPLLAGFFLSKFKEQYNKSVRGFLPEVMQAMLQFPWKGNVRQLRNAVERCVALCDEWISIRDLPPDLQQAFGWLDIDSDDSDFALHARRILEETEKRLLHEALERADGNRRKAADLLGVSLRTLYYKIHKYIQVDTPEKKH